MKPLLLVTLLSFALLVGLFSTVNDAHAYSLANIHPQTIPLWGLAWGTDTVNVRVEAGNAVSATAIAETRQAISDWNDAINTIYSGKFHFVDVTGTTTPPQVTVRVKAGGGTVQGQALANDRNHDGLFDSCKVNVSGQAFGTTNDGATVKSIALQEIGHCLGLLHSDNSADVMFGTLQNPPNTQISSCDVTAWGAVMHWLVSDPDGTSPHPPHVTSVTCP
jgi:predicted Zn-dependent protease